MPWFVLLDVTLGLLAVLLLAVLCLRLWRRIKALTADLGRLTELADQATAAAERLSPPSRPGGSPAPGPGGPSGRQL